MSLLNRQFSDGRFAPQARRLIPAQTELERGRANSKAASMRTIHLAVTAALALSVSAQETLRLPDGDAVRAFVIATDEVHLSGAGLDRVIRLDERGAARAAVPAEAMLQVVLYPEGQARTPGNRRILTRRVSAKLRPGTDAAQLAQEVGAAAVETMPFNRDLAVFRATEASGLALAARLRQHSQVLQARVILARRLQGRALPNDPLFPQQWTLRNSGQSGGTAGADANVVPVWDAGRNGSGVVISVVDDGVESNHPDLAPRIRAGAGFDYRDNDASPEPEGNEGANEQGEPAADSHGTAVAGVAAAAGNNGIGVTGAAYGADLVPVRLIGGHTGDDQEAKAIAHRLDLVQVSNNSWGAEDNGKTIAAPGPLLAAAFEAGLAQGRGGRGTIYVWSAGNAGTQGDNANNDGSANHPGTIAVGALTDLGTRADYSEPGACLIVSAPSGNDGSRTPGTFTTDLLGDRGYNRRDVMANIEETDYTGTFNGTSSAAPLVSGVVALVLQANPNLGWRDVQEVLIRSAAKTDPGNAGWFTNAAGLRFNHDFGAGRIDAAAATQLAQGWKNLGARLSDSAAKLTDDLPPIPDGGGVFERTLSLGKNLRVEHVLLTVELSHPARGELAIDLVSPGGTVSHLFVPHNDPNANLSHRFSSVFHWGENSRGDWRLRIRDAQAGNAGAVVNYQIEVFGTENQVVAPVLRLTAVGLAPGGFRLLVGGPAGQAVVLQRSANLSNWVDLSSGILEGGSAEFTDDEATGGGNFYRLIPATP
jgi:subtilisin family serine protease